jgi:type IV pilus assembly protein PilC
MAQAVATTKSKPVQAAKIPVWRWTAVTKQGEKRSGEVEANDAEAVRARLQQMGLNDIAVRRRSIALRLPKLPGFGGVSTKDILVFTRQFSVMIDAGLPLVQALDIIGTQADNPFFRQTIMTIKGKVEAGSTFADALADHPKVFDELFVQLVRAGEIGGILDTILQRLGAYIEKNDRLKRRVKGAMVYPASSPSWCPPSRRCSRTWAARCRPPPSS